MTSYCHEIGNGDFFQILTVFTIYDNLLISFNTTVTLKNIGSCSSVIIVTRLWAGWPGFNSWKGQGLYSLPPCPDWI